MDYTSFTPEYWLENTNLCVEQLKDENTWNSIPSINSHNLHSFKDNCMVRFHGMIQDMYNPEYYFENYEVENEITKEKIIKCGKYRDTTDLAENQVIKFNSDKNKTSERHTLVVISLPGLNEWVLNLEQEKQGNKTECTKIESTTAKSQKRSIDDEDEPMDTDNTANQENKKICTENKNASTSVVSKEHLLNFPLPNSDGKCCIVKVYDNAENFKLNDMIEVVGFLSVDPVLTEKSYHNNEHDNDLEIQTHNPPPSLVPRIHCVLYKKLTYYNPLTKSVVLQKDSCLSLRKELSVVLTQLLFGDKLAADYLICHLISCVYLRKELMALGQFCLNISNIPTEKYPNYGEELYQFLQLLLPKSHYLPMILDNMNDLAFTPKKDYECNRLTSGMLQLSNNTHLVLDETKLQPGQLNAAGCKAIAALAYTIKNQKVNYDFNYYQMEFDCDIPVLTLSEGMSLLPSDVHVPLMPDNHCMETFPEILEAANHFLNPDLLNNLRVYLTNARHATYNLSDQVLELVQNEFVKLRQSQNITADDLHQLLVLARLICLSKGKDCLDEECWHEACSMETERKTRIAARPRRK